MSLGAPESPSSTTGPTTVPRRPGPLRSLVPGGTPRRVVDSLQIRKVFLPSPPTFEYGGRVSTIAHSWSYSQSLSGLPFT